MLHLHELGLPLTSSASLVVAHFQGAFLAGTRRGTFTHRLLSGDFHEASPVLHRPSRRRGAHQIRRVPNHPIFRSPLLCYRVRQRELDRNSRIVHRDSTNDSYWGGNPAPRLSLVCPEQRRVEVHSEVECKRLGGTYCSSKGKARAPDDTASWMLTFLPYSMGFAIDASCRQSARSECGREHTQLSF